MLSRKVFIASNVFVALVDRTHPNHQQAGAFFRYFSQEGFYLFTGYINVVEAYSKLAANISPSLAREFLRALVLSSVNLIYPTEGDMKAAIKAMVTAQATDLSFADAQMSVLAYRNNIPQLATFDYMHPLFGLSVFSLPG